MFFDAVGEILQNGSSTSEPTPHTTTNHSSHAAQKPQNILTKAIWEVPVDKKMPDPKVFQLTKEMVEYRAKDNVIIITFGNFAFMDFILNWVRHLTELNVFNLLVGNFLSFLEVCFPPCKMFLLWFILDTRPFGSTKNGTNPKTGAMDSKLLEALYWKGVPVFDMGSNMNTMDVGWGSPTFHKMGREKVLLINALLPFGYELLMCDTDMVWLKVGLTCSHS